MARFRESTRYTIEEIQAKAQEDAPYALTCAGCSSCPSSSSSGSPGRPRIPWSSAFYGNDSGVFSITLPILWTVGFVAEARQGSTATARTFVVCSDMLQNSESRFFRKGGTKLRRDDLLAVEERPDSLPIGPASISTWPVPEGSSRTPRPGASKRSGEPILRRAGLGAILWAGADGDVSLCEKPTYWKRPYAS